MKKNQLDWNDESIFLAHHLVLSCRIYTKHWAITQFLYDYRYLLHKCVHHHWLFDARRLLFSNQKVTKKKSTALWCTHQFGTHARKKRQFIVKRKLNALRTFNMKLLSDRLILHFNAINASNFERIVQKLRKIKKKHRKHHLVASFSSWLNWCVW